MYKHIIAKALSLAVQNVGAVIELLDEGCTIPFISRYRKERTGAMDEVQIGNISEMYDKLKEVSKRKETVLKTINELGKMTPELEKRITDCWDATELEDIYLPYKPKRRTRAQVAREQGLEPLATVLLMQREQNPEKVAVKYVKGDVKDVASAIKGAQDIIAETISEDETSRNRLRASFRREAVISSKVVKAKEDSDEAQKFSDYFDFEEPLRRCSGNRLLAMRRGEAEGVLRVKISINDEEAIERLRRQYVRGGACAKYVAEAAADAYKRLLVPSIETEFATLTKQQADEEAIGVFAENLRQLLLAAPLGQKRVMGIDPGIRTGCKVVCLDAQGNLLFHDVVPLRLSRNVSSLAADNAQSISTYKKIARKYAVEAVAIGNGTASREVTEVVKQADLGVPYYVVSEDGASVYSASKVARDEFPDEDVTVRGAVSIGRRLMDPLAELVKIDPKSIGVGQYQHDVDQSALKKSLDRTVESCVNSVGVDLNTASEHLLTYVSGLGPTLAKNIVTYRKENGAFTSRAQLKKVPRLGPSAYQQCAGFLRIRGAKNPLDGSAVHPESYSIVEQMAKDCNCTVKELMSSADHRKKVELSRYVTSTVGMPTLNDIMKELEKPGRDPRAEIETFEFDPNVHTPEDLIEGMQLPGIVTNITKFGAFVDIGVHQDGLVHISQLADKYIADPSEVVHLHQHVKVKVVEVDRKRNRISLSMRGLCLALLLCLISTFLPSNAMWARDNTMNLNADTATISSNAESFRAKQLILPLSVFAVGAVGLIDGSPIDKLSTSVHNDISKHSYHTSIDEWIQYMPVAMHLGLDFVGVKAKHSFVDRAIVAGTSYAFMTAAIAAVKYTVKEQRPDGVSNDSYPSGHTARAFTGAELVRSEYGNGYGALAYAMAVAVGTMRVYNDRHWIHDVVSGAGIGILSARVGYWMLPVWKKVFHLENSSSALNIVPVTYPRDGSYALNANIVF